MTNGATFAQRLMLIHVRSRLFPMALGAPVIISPDEHAGRFVNVLPVRIVAGYATHAALGNGVMVLQVNFGLLFQVTLEASFRIFAGIDNEFTASASRVDVFAAGTMAGLATLRRGTFTVGKDLHAGVQGEREGLGLLMACGASLRTYKLRARNHWRRRNDHVLCRTGNQQHSSRCTDDGDDHGDGGHQP